jgi:PAT family beta-lactamase induction signal transducer AmpG
LSILFLGFSAGIPLAITGSSLSMWISRLGVDIKTIGLFTLVTIPFSFKYIWSSIFDNVSIPFLSKYLGFRKSWLILIQIFLIISIIALGQTSPLENISLTAITALLVAFFAATQDILIDALRIEILEKKEQALGASLYVYGYRIAILVSGSGSLLLSEYISWSLVFAIMSIGIMVGIVTTFFLKEPSSSLKHLEKLPKFSFLIQRTTKFIISKEFISIIFYFVFLYIFLNFITDKFLLTTGTKTFIGFFISIVAINFSKDKFKEVIPDSILDFCNRPKWLHILLFIVFYKFSDTLLDSLKSKFYVDTGFSNAEIAYIAKGLGFLMTMFGLFIGGLIYYRLKTFKSLLLAGILQIFSNLIFIIVAESQHNLVALSVAISVENFTGSINTVVVVAYLSSLCNLNYTATQYALLSSLSNVGRTIMSAPAGYIVDSYGWVNFIWITSFVGIPAIILLYMMKDNILQSENDNEAREKLSTSFSSR